MGNNVTRPSQLIFMIMIAFAVVNFLSYNENEFNRLLSEKDGTDAIESHISSSDKSQSVKTIIQHQSMTDLSYSDFLHFECRTLREFGKSNFLCAPNHVKNQIEARNGNDENGCLVYIVGDGDNENFISDTLDLIDDSCEFHIFTTNEFDEENHNKNIHHYNVDIVSSLSSDMLDNMSFQDAVRSLGHEDHTIDILKVDCDVCDKNLVLDVLDSRASAMQILVKSSIQLDLAMNDLKILKDKGYMIFRPSESVEKSHISFMKIANEFSVSLPSDEIPHNLIFTFRENFMKTKNPEYELFYNNVQKTAESYRKKWDDPDARIIFLDDEDCLNLIREAVPKMSFHFNHEYRGALKADICRIVALYVYGGYYFDVDLEVIEPYIVPSLTSFSTVQGPIETIFFQAFIASAPKHQILEKNFQVLLDLYEAALPGRPQGLTGCWSMKRAYTELSVKERGEVAILEELKLGPEDKYMDLPERVGYGCCCNNLVIDPNDKKAYFYSRIRGYSNRCSLLPLEGKDEQWNSGSGIK